MSQDLLRGFPAPPDPRLAGMRIVESKLLGYQRLKIRDEVPMTDAFRREMNAWLLKMFGREDCLIVGGHTAIVSPEIYDKLHEAVEKHQPP